MIDECRPQLSDQASGGFPFPTQSDLFRQRRSLGRIVGRDHWIIRGQAPLLPILLRRQTEQSQMTSQRLEFLAVLQADQIVRRDGFSDGHSRRLRLGRSQAPFPALFRAFRRLHALTRSEPTDRCWAQDYSRHMPLQLPRPIRLNPASSLIKFSRCRGHIYCNLPQFFLGVQLRPPRREPTQPAGGRVRKEESWKQCTLNQRCAYKTIVRPWDGSSRHRRREWPGGIEASSSAAWRSAAGYVTSQGDPTTLNRLIGDAQHRVSNDDPARSFVGAPWSVLRDVAPARLLRTRAAWVLPGYSICTIRA